MQDSSAASEELQAAADEAYGILSQLEGSSFALDAAQAKQMQAIRGILQEQASR